MSTNPSAVANKFLRDNLQAIAKERRSKPPELMPRDALYLQATRLFAEVDGGIDALNVVEKQLNRLCLERVAEGA